VDSLAKPDISDISVTNVNE